jgi:hypothetical protein
MGIATAVYSPRDSFELQQRKRLYFKIITKKTWKKIVKVLKKGINKED